MHTCMNADVRCVYEDVDCVRIDYNKLHSCHTVVLPLLSLLLLLLPSYAVSDSFYSNVFEALPIIVYIYVFIYDKSKLYIRMLALLQIFMVVEFGISYILYEKW